jgi:hypothetical protein
MVIVSSIPDLYASDKSKRPKRTIKAKEKKQKEAVWHRDWPFAIAKHATQAKRRAHARAVVRQLCIEV